MCSDKYCLSSLQIRDDGALQVRCVAHVKLKACVLDQCSCILRLTDALLAQVHIYPPGELVRHVPLRLAVAREDQRCMGWHGEGNWKRNHQQRCATAGSR